MPGRAPDAKYHDGSCRQKAHRERKRREAAEEKARLARHDAAVEHVGSLNNLHQRRDLLFAVVWWEQWRSAVGL
jgi:hypothetical protein